MACLSSVLDFPFFLCSTKQLENIQLFKQVLATYLASNTLSCISSLLVCFSCDFYFLALASNKWWVGGLSSRFL